MNGRGMILLAAGAVLASRADAQSSGAAQQPPTDSSQKTWYQRDAQKARDKVNEGGNAASAKVVGTRTVTGRVADVSQDRVTVKRSDGKPLSLRITGATKVTSGGKKSSVGALQQGDEVRASYAQSGGSATATKIDVRRSAPTGAGRTSK